MCLICRISHPSTFGSCLWMLHLQWAPYKVSAGAAWKTWEGLWAYCWSIILFNANCCLQLLWSHPDILHKSIRAERGFWLVRFDRILYNTVRTDSGGFHWKLCRTIPINWVLLTNFLITQWDVSPPQLTSQMSQICYNLSLSLVISAMGNFCSRYNIEIIMFCKSCFNSLRCSVWVYELLPETRRTAHHVTACHKSEVDLGR